MISETKILYGVRFFRQGISRSCVA
jgi:hypothetical protein